MSENSSDEDAYNIDNNVPIKTLDKSSTFGFDNDPFVEFLKSPDSDDIFYDEITPAIPSTKIIKNSETISASENLAIQHLDELFNSGSITGSEMASYKKRYSLLCQLLEKSRENEFNLLQLSKKWTIQVEKDSLILNQANDFPDDSNTEVSKMRQSLLKFQNDHLAIEDRLETLNYKIISLEEEKKMLENELNRSPSLKDKETKRKLNDSMNELKKETTELIMKNKEYIESSKNHEENLQFKNDELNANCDNINILKSKLVESNLVLNQNMKSIEKIRKEASEQNEILKSVDNQLFNLKRLNDQLKKNKMEKEELINLSTIDHNKLQSEYVMAQSQLDEVKKLIELAKEKETEMQVDKVKLELDLKHSISEKQKLRDELSSKTKAKDKIIKSLKEALLQLKSSEETFESLKNLHIKVEADLAMYPKSDMDFKENIEKKKRENEHRKKLFDLQNIYSEVEKAKLAQSTQEEERLLYDLSDLRIEVLELNRLAQIKADEREQKAKEYIQKDKRFNHVIDELKEKYLVQLDYEKKKTEIQSKLDDFAKLYNVIQMERNKCANLINSVTHKSSEMREKIRILSNEIEILRTNLTQKEKYVQKQRTKLTEIISLRDSLQSDISKKNIIVAKRKERRDQIQLDIQRLNHLGNQAEEAMVSLRKQNDLALQNRNDRAVQLIERNEELCILQEKFNIKEEIIRASEKETQIGIDEIEFLKQNVKELKRQNKLLRNKLDKKIKLEREAINLKIQVEICRDRLTELEFKVENPDIEKRIRILDGEDPIPINLQYKYEELHIKLTNKEECFLEKELLLEAVTRLVNEIQNKVQLTKTDTIELAKCLNNYKFQMGQIIKKMKAKTAELTMNMSESLQLQHEVKAKEAMLKELFCQIENDDVAFDDFKDLLKINEKKYYESVHRYQLTNGKLTTAEPRPNAYIPENDTDLPIPRPYGANAPFHPSETGSNIRHIRKQKLKPIEI